MANFCLKCMQPIQAEDRVCPHCGYAGGQEVPPHVLKPGSVLKNRYMVGMVIGQGGFGITYVGRDIILNRRVAVKEYYPNGYANRNATVSAGITITDKQQLQFIENGRKKFLSEAQTLAGFYDVPGVVSVVDFFEENNTAYIVMEYLDGRELKSVLKEGVFGADDIVELMRPVMDALEKVHAGGVIHRDISPDNIMWLKSGTLKLMDFGAARFVSMNEQRSISIILKAGYAPEEQYRTRGNQGPWTDIYALCATMYKCITGITPDDSLQRAFRDEVVWPSELGLEISPELEAVLKKGMAIHAEDRFQNINELKAALYGTPLQPQVQKGPVVYSGGDVRSGTFSKGGTVPVREVPAEGAEDDLTRTVTQIDPTAGKKGKDKKQDPAQAEKAHKPKAAVLIGVAAVALLLIGVLIFTILRLGGGGGDTKAGPTGEPALVFDPTTTYRITVWSDEMSIREFNSAVSTLEDRVRILTDGVYSLEVIDNEVTLILPKEAFGEENLETVAICYLTRAIDLYFFDHSDSGWHVDANPLARGDLESVTMSTGTLEGINGADYGLPETDYPYFTLVLTDAAVEKYHDKIIEMGDDLHFAQDMDCSNWVYYYTFPAGDGKTFYVLNNDTSGNFDQVLLYNLTHEPLADSFYYSVDLACKAEWETAESAANPGSLQCDYTEIEGDTTTFVLSSYKLLSAGEALDAELAIKARMDAIGLPYAFGTVSDEQYTKYALCTSLERMGTQVMEMVGDYYGLSIGGDMYCKTETVYTSTLSFSAEAAGGVIDYNGYYAAEEIDALFQDALDNGNGIVYLYINKVPILYTTITEAPKDRSLEFGNMYLNNGEAFNESNEWLLKLVETRWTGPVIGNSFMVEEYSNRSANGATLGDVAFGASCWSRIRADLAAVDKLCENEGVQPDYYLDGNRLSIELHLDVNEFLPELATQLAKQIYSAISFDRNMAISEITIYLVDENDANAERARIFFDRYAGYGEAGHAYVSGIFTNGRLDRYKDAFKTIVTTDSFYVQMNDNTWSRWTWKY